MPEWPLRLRRAGAVDMPVIIGLIEAAAKWLSQKGTDQWAKPWPSEAARNDRILAGLRQRKTWIAWDGPLAAATITADPDPDPYWDGAQSGQPAVYIHRLVVGRPYAGVGLGAELLDWAGLAAAGRNGVALVRVSAWTTNAGLHAYYQRQGFTSCGRHPDDGYPSGVRFEKRIADISRTGFGLFLLDPD
jgi:GNAT superfamily N-acetyltransferase